MVPAHRVTAMAEFVRPMSKDICPFLGAVSYYRRFIEGFANMSALLSPATSKAAPSMVLWTREMKDAFYQLRTALARGSQLYVPKHTDCFVLHTDASCLGIGATLNVARDNKMVPVAFFAKPLQGAQRRYSATELEGLAVLKAIHHFAHFLNGREFEMVTDHKALCI